MTQLLIHTDVEEKFLEYCHERDLDINYVFGYVMANVRIIKNQQEAHERAMEIKNEN